MQKRAIILAGGKGTRLKPYTISLPKPLVPVGDVPILEIIIKQLRSHGFNRITITVNHMAEIIQAFFGNGSKWGVQIDYSLEEKALSTMGPLTLIDDLPDNFLVMNGDILTDLSYGSFFEKHVEQKRDFTIAAHRRCDKVEYGVLTIDAKEQLIQFAEKPSTEYLVSMGIYMMSKKNLEHIPFNTFFGFDHLVTKLIDLNQGPSVFEYDGYWLDIGRPDDYEKAIKEYSAEKF
jgi:NDP-sugar pyrophosphorylase family protein